MNSARSIFLTAAFAISASAADFTLTQNGLGPITVHTELTYEGRGERLIASATNGGTLTLPLVRMCVQRTPGDCLFTLWNETPWEPGKKLEWNVRANKHVPDLGFEVAILWMTDPRPGRPAAPALPVDLATPARPVIYSSKAGLPRIFIEPQGGFESYISAAIIKKQVPVVVTQNRDNAAFTLTSTVDRTREDAASKIARCLFLYCIGMDGNQSATVQLVNDQSEIAWAYNVHKASAGAFQSTAEAIAKHLKEFLESKK